jgi:hypothetical protein
MRKKKDGSGSFRMRVLKPNPGISPAAVAMDPK